MDKSSRIYGIRAVIEAIKAEKPIDKIFIQKGLQGSLARELEVEIKKTGLSASYVPVEKLNKLSSKNHQGVIAAVSPVELHEFESLVEKVISETDAALFLLLDQVSDARNFGAILRTADCTGVHGVIIQKKGAAAINSDTVKTSAGAVFNVPITKVSHLKDAVYYLQSCGIQIVAATEKSKQDVYDLDLKLPTAVIMGSEDIGISPSLLKIVDHRARLPMKGSISSLNVSVASGVFLYEILRQRSSD